MFLKTKTDRRFVQGASFHSFPRQTSRFKLLKHYQISGLIMQAAVYFCFNSPSVMARLVFGTVQLMLEHLNNNVFLYKMSLFPSIHTVRLNWPLSLNANTYLQAVIALLILSSNFLNLDKNIDQFGGTARPGVLMLLLTSRGCYLPGNWQCTRCRLTTRWR